MTLKRIPVVPLCYSKKTPSSSKKLKGGVFPFQKTSMEWQFAASNAFLNEWGLTCRTTFFYLSALNDTFKNSNHEIALVIYQTTESTLLEAVLWNSIRSTEWPECKSCLKLVFGASGSASFSICFSPAVDAFWTAGLEANKQDFTVSLCGIQWPVSICLKSRLLEITGLIGVKRPPWFVNAWLQFWGFFGWESCCLQHYWESLCLPSPQPGHQEARVSSKLRRVPPEGVCLLANCFLIFFSVRVFF